MLAPKDRKYLVGELNYPNPESASRRERELTDRVYGALADFRYLQRKADGRVWEKLRNPDPTPPVEARDGMAAAMALFFEIHQANMWDFEDTVRRAIEGAYSFGSARRGLPNRVVDDTKLEIKTRPIDSPLDIKKRVRRKLENGERLTDNEIAEVVRAGDIDTIHWLQNYLREHRREEAREEDLERMVEDIESLTEDDASD